MSAYGVSIDSVRLDSPTYQIVDWTKAPADGSSISYSLNMLQPFTDFFHTFTTTKPTDTSRDVRYPQVVNDGTNIIVGSQDSVPSPRSLNMRDVPGFIEISNSFASNSFGASYSAGVLFRRTIASSTSSSDDYVVLPTIGSSYRLEKLTMYFGDKFSGGTPTNEDTLKISGSTIVYLDNIGAVATTQMVTNPDLDIDPYLGATAGVYFDRQGLKDVSSVPDWMIDATPTIVGGGRMRAAMIYWDHYESPDGTTTYLNWAYNVTPSDHIDVYVGSYDNEYQTISSPTEGDIYFFQNKYGFRIRYFSGGVWSFLNSADRTFLTMINFSNDPTIITDAINSTIAVVRPLMDINGYTDYPSWFTTTPAPGDEVVRADSYASFIVAIKYLYWLTHPQEASALFLRNVITSVGILASNDSHMIDRYRKGILSVRSSDGTESGLNAADKAEYDKALTDYVDGPTYCMAVFSSADHITSNAYNESYGGNLYGLFFDWGTGFKDRVSNGEILVLVSEMYHAAKSSVDVEYADDCLRTLLTNEGDLSSTSTYIADPSINFLLLGR